MSLSKKEKACNNAGEIYMKTNPKGLVDNNIPATGQVFLIGFR